jgi:hypothetical protein
MSDQKTTDPNWREALMRRHADLFGLDPNALPETARGYPTVGDGWRDLVEKAVARLAAAAPTGSNLRIVQIKEKFATLRLYFRANDLGTAWANIRQAIQLAEARSACTCEICGAEGRPYDADGRYTTRCATHATGVPVAVKPGYENLWLRYGVVDGNAKITKCQRYDRVHDIFIDAPLPPDLEDMGDDAFFR